MNIFGIGVDIVNVKRINTALKNKKNAFIKRVFSKNEIKTCEKNIKKNECYARKFAAKEAFSKAMGTGIGKYFQFKEIEVVNNFSGSPKFNFLGNSSKNLKKILKNKKFKVYLSLTDDKPWAIAFVIISTYE